MINDELDALFDGEDMFEGMKGSEEKELFQPRKLAKYKEDLGIKDNDLTEFDILMDDMSGTHAERMNSILGNLSDAGFKESYMKLLTYVKPKKKAIEVDSKIPLEATQINITVINSAEELIEVEAKTIE